MTVFYVVVILVMVLCVWVYFGWSTDIFILCVIVLVVLVGGIIGFFLVFWLCNLLKKIVIVVGFVGGLLFYLFIWVFFVFWVWVLVLIVSNGFVGLFMDSLLVGVFWFVGSILFGVWFTSLVLVVIVLFV